RSRGRAQWTSSVGERQYVGSPPALLFGQDTPAQATECGTPRTGVSDRPRSRAGDGGGAPGWSASRPRCDAHFADVSPWAPGGRSRRLTLGGRGSAGWRAARASAQTGTGGGASLAWTGTPGAPAAGTPLSPHAIRVCVGTWWPPHGPGRAAYRP